MKNKKISKNELIKQVISLGSKLNRKPMKRDNNSLNYYAKKLFGSWNRLMQAAGFEVRFYQKILSVDFNENFAYFLGLLVTDGHIVYKSKKKYQIAIYTSYPEEKKMLLEFIQNTFNYKAGVSSRIYGFNKRPNYEIRIASKNLVEILVNKFGLISGAKSLSITIPQIIMDNSDTKFKGAFLRGVIDGDGSVLKQTVKIASGSVVFLEEIKQLLKGLNISSTKIIRDNKITNTFSLRICGLKNLIKLYPMIYPHNNCFCYNRKRNLWKTNIFKYT